MIRTRRKTLLAGGTSAIVAAKVYRLLRAIFNTAIGVGWSELVTKAGLPEGFDFHDLRHAGTTLAAASGASTRELMHRMGHGTMRAALIYQHATSDRDREIATVLGARIQREAGEKWPVRGPEAGRQPADEAADPKKPGCD